MNNRLNLPEPIAAYFEADKRDGAALARCFTSHAIVKDEGKTHSGLEAIRKWKDAAAAKYRYVSEPVAVESNEDTHAVTSRVTGNFPGSPVELRYVFRLERGKIASLEIGS